MGGGAMIIESEGHPLVRKIADQRASLTPRGRELADFVLQNPRKVMFMRTRELASRCKTSESKVVRFVTQLGYQGYSDFIQALRDFVDSELTLLERVELSNMEGPGKERFRRIVFEEVDNLKQLYETMNMETIERVVEYFEKSPRIYVVGSRLSYTLAYYLGWFLMKVRPNIQILKGSDSASIDWLTIAPADSLVVIIATTRYPNELIRMARLVRRLGQTLIVITDSHICPLIQFAHLNLVAPSQHLQIFGRISTLTCLINYLTIELAARDGDSMREHQERLEQSYRENDILFNLEKGGEAKFEG
jgi:DNA-binding MurR/RpiR family transcriptional regulator